MKSIEEKAQDYAEAYKLNGAVCATEALLHIVEKSYLAGAAEALASQWRSPEELEGYECDRYYTKILVKYRAKYNGSWLTITSLNSVDEWTDNYQEIHKGDDLIAWMPIPELTETNL